MSSKPVPKISANRFKRINLSDFAGKNVLIMGLGTFGGGAAAAQYCCKHDCHVTVTDVRSATQLESSIKELQDLPIRYSLGKHVEEDFFSSDLIIVNPAVPLDSSYLQTAVANDIPLTTETNLFISRCTLPIIGITGSNGKSTTASLTYEILKTANVPCWLGGNIGKPLLNNEEIANAESGWVVLELSSFQLFALEGIAISPQISIVTNLTPNHLDWHGTLDHYRDSKKNIMKYQSHNDALILNADVAVFQNWSHESQAKTYLYSIGKEQTSGAWMLDDNMYLHTKNSHPECLGARDTLQLPGDFNVSNYLAAATAASLAGASAKNCMQTASQFKGLEHRLELFAQKSNIDFINDSIATTPESTIAAVTALRQPVILLLGGYDKNIDFNALGQIIAQCNHIKQVVILGACKEKIQQALMLAQAVCPIELADRFDTAVQIAIQSASPGDAVLLSPACASYDMFNNFIERGSRFKSLVESWPG